MLTGPPTVHILKGKGVTATLSFWQYGLKKKFLSSSYNILEGKYNSQIIK